MRRFTIYFERVLLYTVEAETEEEAIKKWRKQKLPDDTFVDITEE